MKMTKQIKALEVIMKSATDLKEMSIKDGVLDVINSIKQEKKEKRNETLRLYRFLYGSSSQPKIKEIFLKDLRACKSVEDVEVLYNKFIPYIWVNKTLGSSIKTLTELRNIIKDVDNKISNYALKVTFALGYTDTKKGNKENSKNVYTFRDHEKETYKKIKNEINPNIKTEDFKPSDIKAVVTKLEDIIRNFDKYTGEDEYSIVATYRANEEAKKTIKAYYISFLLALTTGRRFSEILGGLEIGKEVSKLKHENRRKVPTFKGITKKGNDKRDEEISCRSLDASTSTKILFISIEKTQKYLKELRTLIDTSKMNTKEITNKYNAMFNKAFKDRFIKNNNNIDKKYQLNLKEDGSLLIGDITKNNGKKGKPTFHTLRSIYAVTAYKIETEKNPNREINKYEFGASVLLQVYNASASENYMEL